MYSVSEIIVVYTYTFVVLQARGEELTTRFSLCLFLIQPPIPKSGHDTVFIPGDDGDVDKSLSLNLSLCSA